MVKGNGGKGKGKKGSSWFREPGTYAYVKNFRKGLHHQRERCERELHEAREALDDATAASLAERLQHILEKQDALDTHNVLVTDRPPCRRRLTVEEIRFNGMLIREEALQQRRATPATPAAATAPAATETTHLQLRGR